MIACFPLQSYDLFWHLAAGKTIFESGIPREDPFAAHSSGEWINHAWGFDIAARGVEAAGGVSGLLLFRVLLVAGLGWLVWRILRIRGWEAWPAWAMVFLVLALSRHRLDLRPDLLAHLWLALLFLLVLEKRHAWVPVLLLAWVNTHASFLMGWGLALFLLGLEAWRERTRRSWLILSAALVVPLLNPFGWKAFTAPVALQAQVRSMGLVNPEWRAPGFEQFPAFFLVLAGVLALLAAQRRSLKREDAVLLPLALMAAASLRFIGFFAVALAFAVPPMKRRWMTAAAAALSVLALGISMRSFSPPGWGLNASILPVRETAFIQSSGLTGPMFNSPGFGGYLIHELYPKHKVFWDGRNELYPALLQEVREALPSAARWRSLLEKHRIGWAIVRFQGEERTTGPGGDRLQPWSLGHFPPREWALIYWDDAGMVFTRREGLALPEWSVNPESERWVRTEVSAGRLAGAAVRSELERKARENPACRRAARLLRAVP